MRTYSLALTKVEARILARLARLDLAASIHVAMTSPLPPKNKTNYALGKVDAYLAIVNLLAWTGDDQQTAYRVVPEAVLDYMKALIAEAVPATMDDADARDFLVAGQGLASNLERSRPYSGAATFRTSKRLDS